MCPFLLLPKHSADHNRNHRMKAFYVSHRLCKFTTVSNKPCLKKFIMLPWYEMWLVILYFRLFGGLGEEASDLWPVDILTGHLDSWLLKLPPRVHAVNGFAERFGKSSLSVPTQQCLKLPPRKKQIAFLIGWFPHQSKPTMIWLDWFNTGRRRVHACWRSRRSVGTCIRLSRLGYSDHHCFNSHLINSDFLSKSVGTPFLVVLYPYHRFYRHLSLRNSF